MLSLIRAHAFSHFRKPVSINALAAMIRRAADAQDWEDGIEVLSAGPNWISLRLRCRLLTAERLLHFFEEIDSDLPLDDREHLTNAFREMLNNAIELWWTTRSGRDGPRHVLPSRLVRLSI